MGELVVLDEWKRKKEEAEIQALREELEYLMEELGPVETSAYFPTMGTEFPVYYTGISGIDDWTYTLWDKNEE